MVHRPTQMSLIVDALKAAQDERNERSGRADAAARQRFASSTLRSAATLSVGRRGSSIGSAPRSFWVSLGIFVVALAAGGVVVATIPEPGQAALVSSFAASAPAAEPTAEVGAADGLEGLAGATDSGPAGESDAAPTEWRVRSAAPAPNNEDETYVSAPIGVGDDDLEVDPEEAAEVLEAPESQPFVETTAPSPAARAPEGRLEVTLRGAEAPRSNLFDEAVSAQRRGDHTAAVGLYRQFIETQTANAEIFNNYGSALQAAGDLTGARTAFERALSLQPGYAAAWSNLGVLLGHLGEDDGALAALSEAIRLDARNVGARVNLALVYQRRGMPRESIEVLQEALAMEPRHAEANYALGRLLDSTQEYGGALRHYRLFLAHGSSRFPQYEAAVRLRIQQMEANGVR